jgi:hypothetical protein
LNNIDKRRSSSSSAQKAETLILAILTDLKVDLFFEFTIQNIIYNIKSRLCLIYFILEFLFRILIELIYLS